jgi:hypothetical protein
MKYEKLYCNQLNAKRQKVVEGSKGGGRRLQQ